MKKRATPGPVLGHDAPGPRLTRIGAALFALCVAIPLGALIGLVDWAL
ncbi:hypothetical protein [Flavimaricola marinus]|nr:hypothetical protein [Flavimaricola marinus]